MLKQEMCRVRPRPRPRQRRSSAAGVYGRGCTIFTSCSFLQTLKASRIFSQARKTRGAAPKAIWHGGCIQGLDPPFGGLWCDQPALFFASLRRKVRHPAALLGPVPAPSPSGRPTAVQNRFLRFCARARGTHSFDLAPRGRLFNRFRTSLGADARALDHWLSGAQKGGFDCFSRLAFARWEVQILCTFIMLAEGRRCIR